MALDISGDQYGLELLELGDATLRTPREKLRDSAPVCGAGIRIADLSREEFDVPATSSFAGNVYQGRQRRSLGNHRQTGGLFWGLFDHIVSIIKDVMIDCQGDPVPS